MPCRLAQPLAAEGWIVVFVSARNCGQQASLLMSRTNGDGGSAAGGIDAVYVYLHAIARVGPRGTKHDVIARLENLLRAEGIRAGVLRACVPTHKREAWYREQLRRGIDVAICHPKIVETGLDYVE